MAELIGLLLLALTFALVAIATPWFRARQDVRWVERWMLAELFSVFLVGIGSTGGALVFAEVVYAWKSGSVAQLGLTTGAVVIGIPVLFIAARWLGRWMERRAGAKPVPAA